MDVQQLVGAALHELVVDVVQSRVLLRDLELEAVVFLEDGLEALCLARIGCGRLTAAADAAVRAGHDLDEVEELFPALDLGDELIGIAETVRNRNAERGVAGGDFEGLDALETADAALGDGLDRAGARVAEDAADDGFGDAAGDAEDDARAGVIAERIPDRSQAGS